MKKIILVTLFLGTLVLVAAYAFIIQHKKNLALMPELKKSYAHFESQGPGIALMIFAHADDELGTIAFASHLKRTHPELTFKWVIISDGGRGLLFPGTCSGLPKTECRMSEAAKVSECAGLPIPSSLLLPDGSVDQKNLPGLLKEKIPELSSPDLKMVFTHDNRGLYGHPDHVAVYDAVKENLKDRSIPLISMALPEYFKNRLYVMGKASSREALPITHSFDLKNQDIQIKSCAMKAHASQKLIINLLMLQGLTPEVFFETSPREFLNISFSHSH